jgi:hypothetical protein
MNKTTATIVETEIECPVCERTLQRITFPGEAPYYRCKKHGAMDAKSIDDPDAEDEDETEDDDEN